MKKFFLTLLIGMFMLSLTSASGFIIKDSLLNDLFVVDSSGNVNATGWIAEEGIALEDKYVQILDVAVCDAGEFLFYNGTWNCGEATITSINGSVTEITNINASEITTGTLSFDRLPDLTDAITLDYHNITGIPTCDAGEFLTFDGTDLTCEAGAGADFTNVAYTNVTNTFTPDQVFSADINMTGNLNLGASTSKIQRGTTSISIDDTGNLIVVLGS